MCTSMNLKTKDSYFGRTMDIDRSFGEKVIITPRNYPFPFQNGRVINMKYAMIGIGGEVNKIPLYADACNEKGLAIAASNYYDTVFNHMDNEKINLAPYEIIPFLLGQFSSVKEIIEIAPKLNMVDLSAPNYLQTSKLHFMISDLNECIVLEQDKDGLKLYNNNLGVLTNSPSFSYQTTNLINYMNLTSSSPTNRFSDKLQLEPYSLGMGAIGLPGDNSSTSRFVRIAFNKFNSVNNSNDELGSITHIFHLLDTVNVCRGTTVTKDKKYLITIYICCINQSKGIYYYKTYENNQIVAVKLKNHIFDSNLVIYDLIKSQQIKYIN